MKYKIGDKIKIKSWEKLEELPMPSYYLDKDREKYFKELAPDRILTIKSIDDGGGIFVEEIGYVWKDYMIEELVVKEIFEPIDSRFDILDL